MRQIAVVFVLLGLLAGPVLAQPTTAAAGARGADKRAGGGQRGQGGALADAMLERVRSAVEELELSEAQKKRVEGMVAEARRELDELKQQVQAEDFRQRAKEVRGLMESLRGQLADVLTPEQREALGRKLEERNRRFGERRPGAPAPAPALRGAPATGPARGDAARDEGARGDAPRRPMAGAEAMFERLRQNIQKLDLSEDQKTRLKAMSEELREKGEALRDEMSGSAEELRRELRGLGDEARGKIVEILTPEQRERLRELMGPPPSGREPGDAGDVGDPRRPRQEARPRKETRPRAGADGRPGTRPASGGKDAMMGDDAMMSPDSMMQDDMMGAAGAGKTARGGRPDEPLAKGPAVGDPAPSLDLPRLDGTRLRLDNLKGRIVVLVFGSYSSPSFRNRAAALDQLRLQTGTKAQFIVIYAREAHPAGEWDVSRNKQDGVAVQQPRTAADRKALAQTARETLKLTTPIALDTIDNTAAIAYGAGANSAYVIGRDGRIAARQAWFEPLALKRAIDAAAKGGDAGAGE